MNTEKDTATKEQGIKIKEQRADVNEQLNMRIRLILQSFDPSLPAGKAKNPDPGQKLGKQ